MCVVSYVFCECTLVLGVLVAGMACSRTGLLTYGPDGAQARDAAVDLVQNPAPDVRSVDQPAAPIGPGLCGNGKLDPGEECDDGNTVDGDGCMSDCKYGCWDWGCANADRDKTSVNPTTKVKSSLNIE